MLLVLLVQFATIGLFARVAISSELTPYTQETARYFPKIGKCLADTSALTSHDPPFEF